MGNYICCKKKKSTAEDKLPRCPICFDPVFIWNASGFSCGYHSGHIACLLKFNSNKSMCSLIHIYNEELKRAVPACELFINKSCPICRDRCIITVREFSTDPKWIHGFQVDLIPRDQVLSVMDNKSEEFTCPGCDLKIGYNLWQSHLVSCKSDSDNIRFKCCCDQYLSIFSKPHPFKCILEHVLTTCTHRPFCSICNKRSSYKEMLLCFTNTNRTKHGLNPMTEVDWNKLTINELIGNE